MENTGLKLFILYFLSPVDACPGPVDDILVTLIGGASIKGLSDQALDITAKPDALQTALLFTNFTALQRTFI